MKKLFLFSFFSLLALMLIVPAFADAQEHISLNSDAAGISWRLRPQEEVGSDSVSVYKEGYDVRAWVHAVVPGCVFNSYVVAGLESDPNFADNIYRVDQKKYNRNFWYRVEFGTPASLARSETPASLVGSAAPSAAGAAVSAFSAPGREKCWLHFKGVNRKADLFLNGIRLGSLDGFMQRGDFDITGLLAPSGKNILAVLVSWPGKPIANHASPTYISSDGWDWMPSVPGLLQGITDEVYLTVTGGVTITDPWIRADPDQTAASVSIKLGLVNHSAQQRTGVLRCMIQPGNITVSRNVSLYPGESTELSFDTGKYKQLLIHHPALWWPNGYGDPNLYDCELSFMEDGSQTATPAPVSAPVAASAQVMSDSRSVKFGIRKYSYDTAGGVLHILINGRRIFIKGGNWGMSEYLLRCRGKEYDWKVRLHRAMNYNMIRNWIGSTTDEAFYDACDRYGIMVWDDFWLNSHLNLPDDIDAFNRNAVEKIKRFRNHPSIAVWCGENEGYPLPPLNGWLREDVKTFDGGDRLYQANSHSDGLTGSGPWANFHPTWYFTKYPGGFGGSPGWGFRTEIGTAVFTTYESFRKFMPDSSLWPRNAMWDKHFCGPSAANGGPDKYEATINKSYGPATGIEDFCRKAQLVNIETNKALYEGWQHHIWDDASGVMTWMSQSAYPSLVWQTYDYYYDLTGAYWGVKKACEPIHIQWSYADNSVKVINTTGAPLSHVTATAVIYTLDGKTAPAYGRTATVDVGADTAAFCFDINFSTDNLAYKKKAYASSGSPEAPDAGAVSDGSTGSRWSSAYSDHEWVYVDLGADQSVSSLSLNWESAYGKAYRILVSGDAATWTEVYHMTEGKGGVEQITIHPVRARYVKMQGEQRATSYGYSLYDLEVYGKRSSALSDVHFIKLLLTNGQGKLLSDNVYWRSNKLSDYTALNTMPGAKLRWTSRLIHKSGTGAGDGEAGTERGELYGGKDAGRGRDVIEATVTNTGYSVAFAVHVQAVRASDGERILPALMNDNYFTLFKGEHKTLEIEFDPALLKDGKYKLIVEPYNK